MSEQTDHSGMAAFSICEALLLALSDSKLLPEREIQGILYDAAAVHENAVGTDSEMETHRAVAGLINMISVGASSVRQT